MAKRITVEKGDLFLIPRTDGKWVLGQMLDEWMKGIISIAVFDFIVSDQTEVVALDANTPPQVISLPSVEKSEIRRGYWPRAGHCEVMVDVRLAPHYEFASQRYVGAGWSGGKIIERFVDAYYGLATWEPYPKLPNRLHDLLLKAKESKS